MKKARRGFEDPPSCSCKMPQASFSSTALMEGTRNEENAKGKGDSHPHHDGVVERIKYWFTIDGKC